MIPPANHGSYAGKYALFTTAFRYARFMGFSPPNTGCHRSGLAARIHRNSAKPARKTLSMTMSNARSRRSQARKSGDRRQTAAREPAISTSQHRSEEHTSELQSHSFISY